jgi:hypothetical protein
MNDAATKVCPFCGAEISLRAKACRECGADDQTGWSDKTYLDGIDLGDDLDYDKIAASEFGTGRKRPKHLVRTVIAAFLLLLFLLLLLRSYG